MWGLMALGCTGNGANVGKEMVTRRPWACGVVTVTTTAPITSTTTSAGTAQDERQRMRQTVGMVERIQSAQRTQSASAGTTHRIA